MNFIEIRPGCSIRKECIITVIADDNDKTIILTEEGTYPCDFSYSTVLQLLEADRTQEIVNKAASYIPPKVDIYSGQYWRG